MLYAATEGVGLAPGVPGAPGAPGTGDGTGEIVGGPRTPQQVAAQKRLQQTQAQVDEVVDIMKTNVEKVLERDQKLSELDDRADALQQGASQFEQQAGKLKRKFWLQNLKIHSSMQFESKFFLTSYISIKQCIIVRKRTKVF
ncbi:synaptobrevin-1 isoform X3 [Copidosoma floridanum]|uniref:synaptobrevin-1 isoform X3 n=1 Tax=Copidosoma floridanum TaxID=29053 RepID=UPI000C6F78D7|nr:synaptobrevin-1 isoform X3 [Copidosoma floridanum]